MKDVQKKINEQHQLAINKNKVYNFLKNEQKMRYANVKRLQTDPNNWRLKYQRGKFANMLLNILASGLHVINYDETALSNLNYSGRVWQEKGKPKKILLGKAVKRLTVIAAIDTAGRLFVKVHKINSDRYTTIDTLNELVNILDEKDEEWREKYYLMLDGASYHVASDTLEFLEVRQIPVIFMSPFSPQLAPVETVHAYLKKTEIKSTQVIENET